MKKVPLILITSMLLVSVTMLADTVFSDDFADLNDWTLSGNTDPVASGGYAILTTQQHSSGTARSIMTTANSYEGFGFSTHSSVTMTLSDVSFGPTSGASPVLFVGFTPDPTAGTNGGANGLPVLTNSIYLQQVSATSAFLYMRDGGVSTQLAQFIPASAGLSLSYDSIVMELSPIGWSITLTAAGGSVGTPQTGTFAGGAPSWADDLHAQVLFQQGSVGAENFSELSIGAFEVASIPEVASQSAMVGLLSLLAVFGLRRKGR